MLNKFFIGTNIFIFIVTSNLFAINMSHNYKISISKLNIFFAPAKRHKDIVEIQPKYRYNARFILSYEIFVKKNLHNMGIYRWDGKKNYYIGEVNKRILIFKKNNLYLISSAKTITNNNLKLYFNNLNKNNVSPKKLKNIFHAYSKTHIKYRQFKFYNELIQNFIKNKLLFLRNNEYLFLVDKNTQKGYIFIYSKNSKNIKYIGGDKLSTGNPKLNSRNNRFFETPIAIINRKNYYRGDWRANRKTFSEYGIKNNRIFYLGKYIIPIEHSSKIKREIHLAIHSTNPIDNKFLGYKASKGCIRISQNLNKLLNKSGIIDGQNGKYVIIADSSLSIKENLRRLSKLKSTKH